MNGKGSHRRAGLAVLALAAALAAGAGAAPVVTVERAQLLDRIRGGWAGKMVGVSLATHTEFMASTTPYFQPLPWDVPTSVSYSHTQDDLYAQMPYVRVIDTAGIDATALDFARALDGSPMTLYHANFFARKNIMAGIFPPRCGSLEFNPHAEELDFQIGSDFIGLMCPAMPNVAAAICGRAGTVLCQGDGIYGGMFVAGMYSEALVSDDPAAVVDAGLALIPPGSRLAMCVRDVRDLHRAYPQDWLEAWSRFSARWVKKDACPDFAGRTIDVSAAVNSGYVALGLLYGEGDFVRTVSVATRCGQDSDCNGATAGGIVGAMLGMRAIPPSWRGQFEKVRPLRFSWSEYTFDSLCDSSLRRAILAARSIGGGIRGTTIRIPRQAPKPPVLDLPYPGQPERFVPADDAAWKWTGKWLARDRTRQTTDSAAIATLTFTGTGVLLHAAGGREFGSADIRVDGKAHTRFEGHRPYDSPEVQYYLGATSLPPGQHKLEIRRAANSADDATSNPVLGISGAHVLSDTNRSLPDQSSRAFPATAP